jgi:hypothetical protein
MLLPDKHIFLAESLLGLGAFILGQLDRPKSIDDIHSRVYQANETEELPAFHNFESVTLAVLFLYTIGAVEMIDSGDVRRCVS